MDEMEFGLDRELGMAKSEPAIAVVEGNKPARRMFYDWEVGGNVYKMKLNTSMICVLENKFKRNLLSVITDDGIPPLQIMLTVAQAAISPWNHKVDYSDVQKLFDKYVSEGGNQMDFYTNVIMQTMAVSGFFTEAQAKEITEKMKTATAMI